MDDETSDDEAGGRTDGEGKDMGGSRDGTNAFGWAGDLHWRGLRPSQRKLRLPGGQPRRGGVRDALAGRKIGPAVSVTPIVPRLVVRSVDGVSCRHASPCGR
jgi:hypothetical protein